MAERKCITCPETAQLKEIDLERTPLGVVIAGCSRFAPRSAVICTRDCAKRMDNRDRDDLDDQTERVLIAYAGGNRTSLIARALSDHLARDGFTVELADAHIATPPPPEDYDAVVIGSPAGLGAYPQTVVSYLRDHGRVLATMPGFFFLLREPSMLRGLLAPQEHIERLVQATGWRPTEWMTFESANGTQQIQDFAVRIADLVPATEGLPSLL